MRTTRRPRWLSWLAGAGLAAVLAIGALALAQNQGSDGTASASNNAMASVPTSKVPSPADTQLILARRLVALESQVAELKIQGDNMRKCLHDVLGELGKDTAFPASDGVGFLSKCKEL